MSQQLHPRLNNLKGFHIEPTNICTLKCPGCARTRFIEEWPQHWKNYNIDLESLLKFIDVDLDNIWITLCGNYGDPIYHPEFHQLIAGLKQRGANLHIITNGSYRTESWWQQLCELLTTSDIVGFSIDGMPDNFTQYRVNANWASIEIGMKTCAAASCKTEWRYIPFSYNQYCIDSARELSRVLKIDQFIITPSSRFDQKTEYLKPSNQLISHQYPSQIHWKNGHRSNGINPICANQRQYYISADGHYMPCCFIGDHRFLYKTPWGKQRDQFNIENTTFSKILASDTAINFNKDLSEHSVCQHTCTVT
jgi:organic radical activating enzyme